MDVSVMNSVCCVIVTYNIGSNFYSCFNSINGQTEKIVIVDNGSNSETTDILKELDKLEYVHVIYNKENMGIAYALNQGVNFARSNGMIWTLTMDNDSKATPNMVSRMLRTFETLPDKAKSDVVSIFPSYIEESDLGKTNKDIYSKVEKISYNYVISEITSGNLVKTEVFDRVGMFLEKYFIDYVDIEFCLRLSKNGFKLIKLNEVYLIHNLGKTEHANFLFKSASYTNHNYVRRYYITRNRFDVWGKYLFKFPVFILKDIYAFIAEFFKVLLFEKNKIIKLKMIFKGIYHTIIKKFGVI